MSNFLRTNNFKPGDTRLSQLPSNLRWLVGSWVQTLVCSDYIIDRTKGEKVLDQVLIYYANECAEWMELDGNRFNPNAYKKELKRMKKDFNRACEVVAPFYNGLSVDDYKYTIYKIEGKYFTSRFLALLYYCQKILQLDGFDTRMLMLQCQERNWPIPDQNFTVEELIKYEVSIRKQPVLYLKQTQERKKAAEEKKRKAKQQKAEGVVKIEKTHFARFNKTTEKFHNNQDGTGVEMKWTRIRYDWALESLGILKDSETKTAMKKELDRVNLKGFRAPGRYQKNSWKLLFYKDKGK